MDKSREELEKEYAEATVKLEQYQHKGQRLESRIKYYQQGDRKKRNHRLMSKFHNYSANNIRLIEMQCPGATYVAGYRKPVSDDMLYWGCYPGSGLRYI